MYKLNDIVVCQLYNSVERKYYGDMFKGQIIEINWASTKPYLVKRFDDMPEIWLHEHEILIN
jgi:hypothetical protein